MKVAAQVRNSLTERKKSGSKDKPALKQLDMSIIALENRLKCLRLQKQRKEEKIEVTRRKAQSILEKKVNAESLVEPTVRLEQSSAGSPREQRKAHEREMRNIKQAIYLVKLDQARQLKQANEQHRHRMLELERERSEQNRKRHETILDQTKQKRKYYEFMGRKLADAKKQHLEEYVSATKAKQQKLKLIEDMEREEKRLKEEIQKEDLRASQANRQYVAAYNLPRQQAVRYLESELNNNSSLRESKLGPSINTQSQKSQNNEEQDAPDKIKMPGTNLRNQLKLRLVLSELKRRSLSTIE